MFSQKTWSSLGSHCNSKVITGWSSTVTLYKVTWNRFSQWIYSPQVSTLTSCSSMDLIGLSEWTTSSCESIITSTLIKSLPFSCQSIVNSSFNKLNYKQKPTSPVKGLVMQHWAQSKMPFTKNFGTFALYEYKKSSSIFIYKIKMAQGMKLPNHIILEVYVIPLLHSQETLVWWKIPQTSNLSSLMLPITLKMHSVTQHKWVMQDFQYVNENNTAEITNMVIWMLSNSQAFDQKCCSQCHPN